MKTARKPPREDDCNPKGDLPDHHSESVWEKTRRRTIGHSDRQGREKLFALFQGFSLPGEAGKGSRAYKHFPASRSAYSLNLAP